MRIGLIDVDGHNFPNLPLMKLSAWHKQKGDTVEWYSALNERRYDKVYMSKVFSFTPDYPYFINADEIIKGGSGYAIRVEDGKEIFDKSLDKDLPYEIEHIYPDYSIYYDKIDGMRDTAYGFLTRGCPRGCEFCHVVCKEGRKSYKVADLNEFWRGQTKIVLCDPNITAAHECLDLFDQLIDSNSWIELNQGLDIRMMTEAKIEKLKQIKIKHIHFAWDRYQDKDKVVPKFEMFKELYGGNRGNTVVYILSNFDTTLEQDLERIYFVRDLGYSPYLMVYQKDSLPVTHTIRKLQRYVNNRYVFNACESFDEYLSTKRGDYKKNENQITLFE